MFWRGRNCIHELYYLAALVWNLIIAWSLSHLFSKSKFGQLQQSTGIWRESSNVVSMESVSKMKTAQYDFKLNSY